MGRELGGELAPGFMFALEKGACRSHPLVDDIEQGPVPARCLERPRPPFGARELDVHRVLVFAVDKAHAPSAVHLDALWQKAPAEGLGVGHELGIELALSFVFAFETGFNLALEKGAPRLHRLGRGAAVFFDVDDVEQVAWVAG